MKKFYSILACAAVTLSASAATSLATQNAVISNPGVLKSAVEISNTGAPKALRSLRMEKSAANAGMSKVVAKAPAGTWKSLGKGTYSEDLLTLFSDIAEGQRWEVEIEQNETEAGWYRLLPYASGPVAEQLEAADTENYLYINATDPAKVYAEDFTPFGLFPVSHLVTENEWQGYEEYGTLQDGVISFPANSFALQYSGGWHMTAGNGGVQIALPGVKLADYAFKASSPYCTVGGKSTVAVTCGADVAYFKYMLAPGHYKASGNEAVIAANGTKVEGNVSLSATPNQRGIYSFLAVAFNAADESVASSECYFLGAPDEDDQWEDLGKGSFTEGIYAAGYSDIDNETFDVDIQKHKTVENYYRIVNPYKNHSVLGTEDFATVCTDHVAHYMYINANRAEYVTIEPSVIGVNCSGEGAVLSLGFKYIGTANEAAAKNANYFGTYDAATRTISFPDNCILLGEDGYDNGAFLLGNTGTKLVLPEDAGVSSIVADEDNDAAVEFFNLQGMRISEPAAGQMVIRRQGSKVQKMLVK